MIVQDILNTLNEFAPYSLQEDYDNSGLQVGNPLNEVKGVLISLDCTEAILDEAIQKGCNVVLSHHPLIFKALKRITGVHYTEKIIYKAIKHDINLISCHTNLDHMHAGVNKKIAECIGLTNVRILSPKHGILKKLVTFCPKNHVEQVHNALFEAGGGFIGNYSECSFNTEGYGTFKAHETAKPFVGKANERHHEPELRIELVFEAFLESTLIQVLRSAHPYEEVAYDIYQVDMAHPNIGAGMVGEFEKPLEEKAFLKHLQQTMNAKGIRFSNSLGKPIKTVAICGGSGFFLLSKAKAQKVDAFVTADIKYHEFFEANGDLLLIDIGHYESEQYTNILFMEILTKKFPKFAIHVTEQSTNSINYLI